MSGLQEMPCNFWNELQEDYYYYEQVPMNETRLLTIFMVTKPSDLPVNVPAINNCILQLLVGLMYQVYHELRVSIAYGRLVNTELH